MTKKITHLALALVTLLTGCSMLPTYERPAAPVPTGFPNVAASESHATLPSWRTYFAEPRLQQLIELALNNNRDLRIASLNVASSRYVVLRNTQPWDWRPTPLAHLRPAQATSPTTSALGWL